MQKKVKDILNVESLEYVLVLVLVGITAGGVAYGFHQIIHLLVPFIKTNIAFNLQTTLYSLGVTFLSIFLTKTIFPDTKGSGIPQVKLALVALRGELPKRLGIGKFITTTLTLLSGLSFGKEGPCVTVSSAFAYLYSHIFKLNVEHRKLVVLSGASAGLSAAFFTPIAAVAFTLEEIIGELNTKYLTPIMITSCIAAATAYELFGNNKTSFSVVEYTFVHKINLFYYVILGLLIGVLGVLWVHFAVILKKFKSNILQNEYIYLVTAVLLIAVASNINQDVLGDGVEVINSFIEGKEVSFLFLAILLVLKFFTSSVSYSTGLSGGLFMPVLFIGACGGMLIGKTLVILGVSTVQPGAFALLGMTSMLVAVIRTPLTAFIMLFEMTRDYDLILPLMISSVVSFFVANLLLEESVYEVLAEYEGVHLPTQKDNETMESMQIEDCIQTNVYSLESDLTAAKLILMKEKLIYSGYPILKDGNLVGIMNQSDIERFLSRNENLEEPNDKDEQLIDHCHKDLITIYPDQSFLMAFEKMKRFSVSRLPVVSRFNTRRLVGIITAKDLIEFFELSKSAENN